MSKRIDSTATKAQMAKIGKTLEADANQTLKINILAWVDENRDCYKKLWQLMESGLIHDILNESRERVMPRSCVKVGFISKYMQLSLVKRGSFPLGRDLVKMMKGMDSKAIDKLFIFKYQCQKDYPMQGGLPLSSLYSFFDNADTVAGCRLDPSHADLISNDGSIRWSSKGVYAACKVALPDGSGNAEPTITIYDNPADYPDATHIIHRFRGKYLSLVEDLELPKLSDKYYFVNNWDETIAELTNGRHHCKLYDDFKEGTDGAWIKRRDELYGNTQWQASFGPKALESRLAAKREARAANDVAAKAMAKVSALGGPLAKKRRKL